jgi:hypothetical protein
MARDAHYARRVAAPTALDHYVLLIIPYWAGVQYGVNARSYRL